MRRHLGPWRIGVSAESEDWIRLGGIDHEPTLNFEHVLDFRWAHQTVNAIFRGISVPHLQFSGGGSSRMRKASRPIVFRHSRFDHSSGATNK